MSSYHYPIGIRYRAVVSAWREPENDEWADREAVERVVCVEVDVFPAATQRQRAREMVQATIQTLYPRVNAFDIYNLVDEVEDPAAVLGYVTGWADGHECFEPDPVVVFRQPNDPSKYREHGARSWTEYFAPEEVARRRARIAV